MVLVSWWNNGWLGIIPLLLSMLFSGLLAIVLFAASKKLKGVLRWLAIIFGILAVISIVCQLVLLLIVIALLRFT